MDKEKKQEVKHSIINDPDSHNFEDLISAIGEEEIR